MQAWFLKEYGAWSVFIISVFIGVGVSRTASWTVIPLSIAMGLLINSKQAYTVWVAQKISRLPLLVFFVQVAAATGMLLALFGGDIVALLPLLVFPVAYLLMRGLAGEHALLTELLGFAVLSLAAVIVKFSFFGGLDVRLFVAVVFFFMAGVFKVKALLAATAWSRALSLLYIATAVAACRGMHIQLIILLPLLDNVIAAIIPYKASLRTTGWIEVGKGIAFLALMIRYY